MTTAPETQVDPLLSEEFQTSPQAVLERLRREDPALLVPGVNARMVTRHDDVLRLFTGPNVTNDRRA